MYVATCVVANRVLKHELHAARYNISCMVSHGNNLIAVLQVIHQNQTILLTCMGLL